MRRYASGWGGAGWVRIDFSGDSFGWDRTGRQRLTDCQVSDGIIAAGYEPEALEILKAKKGGKYIVLQADPKFEPPLEEVRTIFGTSFRQHRAAEVNPVSIELQR